MSSRIDLWVERIAQNLRMLYRQRAISTLLALIFATIACAAMVSARVIYTDTVAYTFLLWNLFLAWVPYGVSFVHYVVRPRSRVLILLSGAVWLAFLPNAPYIVTDLIHLRRAGSSVPVWFDAIMIASFAWTGLFLGIVSLRMMQGLVRRRLGAVAGWCFALAALALSSVGVYLGRFERWNSWDIVTNPIPLFGDLARAALNPLAYPKAIAVVLLFTTFLTATYIMTSTLLARRVEAGDQEF